MITRLGSKNIIYKIDTKCVCIKQYHHEFNTVFRKSRVVFCAKPKKVNPIKPDFSMTNKCFDSTQIYNY